jgi:hypothetical protein
MRGKRSGEPTPSPEHRRAAQPAERPSREGPLAVEPNLANRHHGGRRLRADRERRRGRQGASSTPSRAMRTTTTRFRAPSRFFSNRRSPLRRRPSRRPRRSPRRPRSPPSEMPPTRRPPRRRPASPSRRSTRRRPSSSTSSSAPIPTSDRARRPRRWRGSTTRRPTSSSSAR